jgi:hypothetical protein
MRGDDVLLDAELRFSMLLPPSLQGDNAFPAAFESEESQERKQNPRRGPDMASLVPATHEHRSVLLGL